MRYVERMAIAARKARRPLPGGKAQFRAKRRRCMSAVGNFIRHDMDGTKCLRCGHKRRVVALHHPEVFMP